MISLLSNSPFTIKKTVRKVTPLSTYDKNLSVFSTVKKIIVNYDNNGLLRTIKIICEKKKKRSEIQ